MELNSKYLIQKPDQGGCPPKLRVREIQLFERDVTLRLPFRFGVVTVTQAPQAFVRCHIQLADGREGWGSSAELMIPKWFDKSPALSNEDNFDQLRRALHLYRDAILTNGMQTAFGHYTSLYQEHLDAAAGKALNPLAASFGPALIDRAVMDGLCRIENISFASSVQANRAGIHPEVLLAEFNAFDMSAFLGALAPSQTIHARHTIGMVDPLTRDDQAPEDRLDDGLPESLEEVIETYGCRYFKIKVGGDLHADMQRLAQIAAVLDRSPMPYQATLDGNEQYENVDGVIELLEAMRAAPGLKRMMGSILLIEQPIRRSQALAHDVTALAGYFPVIIDESDAELASFPAARARGYSGVSSKNCKGFYKSLINLARCNLWSEQDGKAYFMSGEDLTCQAGIAVQQDLALVALLGLGHVERNGHHYVTGMAGADADEQARFLAAHPDLYRRVGGQVCTHIENGIMSIGSLQCTGFGVAAEPDWQAMQIMALAH
ncbi:MAG: mandelate racemase [Rhodospirillales bacterium]|nr:mandelate racemase [Rhodospirillales bacterium]